ncbi:MAG: redoxin protein, partial [Rhizorhabdus sp.]|nr:redoxin protein [Rhizorhabdus sp.]
MDSRQDQLNASRAAARLLPGDFAPSFRAPALGGNPDYVFNSAAGRYILLLFFGSVAPDASAAALRLIAGHRGLFDDQRACFFGISCDPDDAAKGVIAQSLPGIRFFLDPREEVSALYGAADPKAGYDPHWLLLDRGLQVIGAYDIGDGARVLSDLSALVTLPPIEYPAPVLVVPRLFEPELCRYLVGLYEQAGGTESGFMREVDGRTVAMLDHSHKRRSDWTIEDDNLRRALAARINRRLRPRIQHAFQFDATRLERYIVACYESGVGGYFRPHRDNTTKGTAHRRFAVTINLNAEDYDGGDLRFPEYGDRTWRAPTGGA